MATPSSTHATCLIATRRTSSPRRVTLAPIVAGCGRGTPVRNETWGQSGPLGEREHSEEEDCHRRHRRRVAYRRNAGVRGGQRGRVLQELLRGTRRWRDTAPRG